MNTNKISYLVIALLLIPLFSQAELKSGYFEGKAVLSNQDEEQEEEQEDEDVQIFVNVTEEDPAFAFGLIILKGEKASAYRIEELEDGTQSWIALFQSGDHYLRVKDDFLPLFKGYGTRNEKKRLTLRLVTQGASSAFGGIKEIHAKQVYKKEWLAFSDPKVGFPMEFTDVEKESHGVLDRSQHLSHFRGLLAFDGGVSLEGNFSLTAGTPYLAAVRSQVLNPENLSGWSQAREMLGVAALIFHKGKKGRFLGLRNENPKYELMFIRLSGNGNGDFEKISLFKEMESE